MNKIKYVIYIIYRFGYMIVRNREVYFDYFSLKIYFYLFYIYVLLF